MADEKLSPERAVRLLRAKAAELENIFDTVMTSPGTIEQRDLAYARADIALIASLLADHIERVEALDVRINCVIDEWDRKKQTWGPEPEDWSDHEVLHARHVARGEPFRHGCHVCVP